MVEPLPGTWYHNIDFGGLKIAGAKDPSTAWSFIKLTTYPLVGKTVLDIGCAEGFHSVMCRREGARVTAIDYTPAMIEKAKYLAENLSCTGIKFECIDLFDFNKLGEKYDVVLFMAVLHHQENPLGALRRVSSWAKDVLLIECAFDSDGLLMYQPEGEGAHIKPTMTFHEYPDKHLGFFPNITCLASILHSLGWTEVDLLTCDANRIMLSCKRKA